ncbi:hypothetical protein M405DRAFT_449139 [Rhizopogon salebrosus TDB-379]|nr:hypothetical protein M405DRAFT_449139 [Rhizopogon salebrosus TDB-379]
MSTSADDSYSQSSQPSLPSEPCDPFPRSRLWDIFSTSSLIRMKRCFFSAKSPLQVPTNNKPTKPIEGQEVRVGDEDKEHEKDIDLPDCSANITPRAAGRNNDKGKQEEEYIADTQTRPRNDPSPTEFNNNGNRALRKLLISTRWKNTKKATAKIPCDLSPEVVEICTARGFKRIIVRKRKHKAKLRVSQASRSPSPHTFQNTTSDSDSDSIIEGFWNKFLDKMCFPCGHYHEDT